METDKKTKTPVVVEDSPRTASRPGGRIHMSEDVVATIAGMAARDIDGIYALGKSRLINFGDNPSRGVEAEVGKKEAALDLEVVIDYGCDLRAIAGELRDKVSEQVEMMAGRKVVEVNLDVIDVHLPEKDDEDKKEMRRVV
jgi:uncharacterized alkaline shock family protein YloU